jgi:hypothetical protein
MTLIKGFEEPQQQGFNENTLEWKGKKLKEMHHKELIDIIVNLFKINLALQTEMEQHKRILTPYS